MDAYVCEGLASTGYVWRDRQNGRMVTQKILRNVGISETAPMLEVHAAYSVSLRIGASEAFCRATQSAMQSCAEKRGR